MLVNRCVCYTNLNNFFLKEFMKLLIATILVGTAGFAQAANVGVLDDIQGVVSVSMDGKIANVSKATELQNGNVVLTSANGSAMVRFDKACNVPLKPNQVLTIDGTLNCAGVLASVKTVSVPVASAAGAGSVNPLLIAAGVVGGAVIINNVTKNKASGS